MNEWDVTQRELEVTPWLEDEQLVFAAPDHPVARWHWPLTDTKLLAARWIVRASGSGTRQTYDRDMRDLRAQLDVRFELQLSFVQHRRKYHSAGAQRCMELCPESAVQCGPGPTSVLYRSSRHAKPETRRIRRWRSCASVPDCQGRAPTAASCRESPQRRTAP